MQKLHLFRAVFGQAPLDLKPQIDAPLNPPAWPLAAQARQLLDSGVGLPGLARLNQDLQRQLACRRGGLIECWLA